MASFSRREAIKYGWQKSKENLGFFIIYFIITAFISWPLTFLLSFTENIVAYILLPLIMFVVQLEIALGATGASLKIYDGKKFDYKELFNYFNLLPKWFLAAVLYCIIVVVGFVFLIIPGIILSIRLHYFTYFMLDKKMGPIESLKNSWEITKGQTWNLFLLVLLLMLVGVVGLIGYIVGGLLLATSIAIMAEAYVYRKLSGSK